jgi:hypothetical protein
MQEASETRPVEKPKSANASTSGHPPGDEQILMQAPMVHFNI